ncbi:MAG: hypothetical protein SP1CHLAM54_07040 [Chlamydiia bacterium]|nr:hypothetical protein [Chlamydiia bacterium]MCH9615610.1 hypothetical protein [Chlamydiia bacterium]MCH9628987.1 hypothetical protein [Chlamydiia bacterium]
MTDRVSSEQSQEWHLTKIVCQTPIAGSLPEPALHIAHKTSKLTKVIGEREIDALVPNARPLTELVKQFSKGNFKGALTEVAVYGFVHGCLSAEQVNCYLDLKDWFDTGVMTKQNRADLIRLNIAVYTRSMVRTPT